MVMEPLGKRSLRRLIGRDPDISFESKISAADKAKIDQLIEDMKADKVDDLPQIR